MNFKELQLGAEFNYNGNLYVKKSTRTAVLKSLTKIFYFGKDDNCTLKIEEPIKKEIYRIYGKHTTDKSYSALGSEGLIGKGNLIYAYFYEINTKEDMIKLDNSIEHLNTDNPDFKFEKRKV